jgi:hypothetical protein
VTGHLRFDGGIRQVAPPLGPADLLPLQPNCTAVQFTSRLSDDDMRLLADFLAGYPDVRLRVYGGYDGSIADLDFLRFFPRLRRFSVDAVYRLPSLDGIGHLSTELEDLLIGMTASKRFSLGTLTRFTGLRTLYLEGQQKDFEAIGKLEALEDLTIRSITLPDLAALVPLQRLRSLDIKLGGTRDIALAPRIGALEYVELWMVRGLDDVSALAEVPTLKQFFLQALKNVTRLPSFRDASALRGATLQTMKGITDLSPLAEAPNLESVNIIDMGHLQPEALRPFVGHPTLRSAAIGLGSDRKNADAWDLLPLGPKPFNYDVHREREARRRRS